MTLNPPAQLTSKTRSRRGTPFLLALAFATATEAPGAKLIKPPSTHLFEDSSRVLVGRAREVSGLEVEFSIRKSLRGELMERVCLLLDAATAEAIVLQAEYVLGLVDSLPVRFPGVPKPSPGGPVVQRLPGFGEAILPYSKDVESFLDQVSSGVVPTTATATREKLISGLRSSDPLTQRFFAAELTNRPAVHSSLGRRDMAVIAGVVGGGEADPAAREMLLAYGARFGGEPGWRLEAARDVLAKAPTDLDLASYLPSLVRTCLEVVAGEGVQGDRRRIRPWLASNSVGVVSKAADALVRLSPDRAAKEIARVLSRDDLRPEVRSELESFAYRLEIMKRRKDHEQP